MATSNPAPHDPPNPWMLVRLMRPGEDDLKASLDAHIRQALASCPRCSAIYGATGLLPVSCHECGAVRNELWLATLEDLARQKPPESTQKPLRDSYPLYSRLAVAT